MRYRNGVLTSNGLSLEKINHNSKWLFAINILNHINIKIIQVCPMISVEVINT